MEKYIVYQTTNKINNKIYIGVHCTNNPDGFDGYIGCGVRITQPCTYMNPKTPFQFAVKKYGTGAFIRTTLAKFLIQKKKHLNQKRKLLTKSFFKEKMSIIQQKVENSI